ncbi:MAG: CRTAC1 family protein [Acidobacteriota bacterium]|jgi:hypothetical protein
MSRTLHLIWTTLLVAMLVGVVVINRSIVESRRAAAAAESGDLRRGFRFEEVSAARGVRFVHQAPTFDAKLEHIMPQIASMGAAVAVADFDRDGWLDFYVTNSGEGSLNALYRNNGDGTFTEVAAAMGVADVNRPGTGVSTGAVWGDYDNDGYEDLFLYKYGRPELFRNDGGVRFERVTDRVGLPAWVNSNAAIWFDFDRDGWLDLFLGGYWSESVDLWNLETTRIMPESFEYAENGGRNYLFRNLGDGTFEECAEAMGVATRRWTLAAAAADLAGTGYPDLFLANDYGISELFANQEGRGFVEVGVETGVGRSPKSGMNAAFGDIFNDGRLAIYKTNISEPGVLVQANDLWVPRGLTASGLPVFENLATTMGVDLGGWSWGAQFGDLNNDGTLDLFLVNGYVSAGERTSYWYDFAQIAVGHNRIIGDARNWPAMRGRSLSGYQHSRVWINDGQGRFVEVAQEVGVTDTFDGRSIVFADLGNRGVLDAIVANQKGPLLIYANRVAPGRHWIAFELEGTTSNRSAIGARVEVHWGGRRQVQEVSGGSGFSGQNQRRLHYGLGDVDHVDRVVIRWPSGRVDTLESPAVDRLHRVREGE